eukprot:3911012-Rhodomonas_salina.1
MAGLSAEKKSAAARITRSHAEEARVHEQRAQLEREVRAVEEEAEGLARVLGALHTRVHEEGARLRRVTHQASASTPSACRFVVRYSSISGAEIVWGVRAAACEEAARTAQVPHPRP